MIRSVILVEDEDDTRATLAQMIAADPGLNLCSEFALLAPALAAIRATPPDVLVTDLRLPDGVGYDLIRCARGLSESMAILVISVLGDEAALGTAIRAGADGYLLKDSDQDTVVSAIHAIMAGGSPISASMARFLLKRIVDEPEPSASSDEAPLLTAGERRVLSCIARGYTYNETAEQLNLSPNTVPSYIKNIYRKLRVHSRGEAVFEALRRGMLDSP